MFGTITHSPSKNTQQPSAPTDLKIVARFRCLDVRLHGSSSGGAGNPIYDPE